MTDYTQTDRPLKITTPLGPDIVLISGLHGHEEISQLFVFGSIWWPISKKKSASTKSWARA